MENNLIQVLWVEDDPMVIQSYPMEAADHGLELVPFSCWKDAEEALSKDFNRWSAIILDAQCKFKKDSKDNALKFLPEAMHSIDSICLKNHRMLPWYILSGDFSDELSELVIESREEWDGDWHKKYYDKSMDREILFHRIPYHAKISPLMQIRNVHYADVFKAIKNSGISDDIEVLIEDLLLPILTGDVPGKDYNRRMTNIRKCIELIFQSMAKNGILPNEKIGNDYVLHNLFVDRRGGINITWCSNIIAGKDIIVKDELKVKSHLNILPNVLRGSIQRLIEISGANEHAVNRDATPEQFQNSRQTSDFLDEINNAPYLLRGMVMELCTIILWYDQYLTLHNDPELNALNWEII